MNSHPDIAIIAPRGMLGRAWCNLLDERDIPYDTIARPSFDITARETMSSVPASARVVINCCAWTDVDAAEMREQEATAVNGTGVGELAARCKKIGATLVHYSTDYVFDGQATTPYKVNHPRNPLGAYGRSKALGEEMIQESGCDHLIIRTSWLYAPWGKNFVRTMAKLTHDKPELRVVNDQRGRPTSSEHLARISHELIKAGVRGVYHVTDGDECTWYEFTAAINEMLGHTCRITPCTTAEFPRPAKRPAYSVLDLSKVELVLGPMPHWKENLAAVLGRLEPSAT